MAAGLAGAAAAATGPGEPVLRFPRDHYAHPKAGIEWWYFTGALRGSDGRRYSVFYTLFSSRGFVAPTSQVVDLDTGRILGHSESAFPVRLPTDRLAVRIPGASLGYDARRDTWSLAAARGSYALSIFATPLHGYTLHGGGTGVIRQSVAGTSRYYSATRMRATGTVRAGGKTVRLAGQLWLDRQWGDWRDDRRAFDWDWFSCRFDDGSDLMLYRFRTRAGKPLPAVSTGTYVEPGGRSRAVREYSATAGARRLRALGRSWPLDWTLAVRAPRMTLHVRSLLHDQIVRGRILPTFWEGAASVTGTRRGLCFVELAYR